MAKKQSIEEIHNDRKKMLRKAFREYPILSGFVNKDREKSKLFL